MLGSLVNQCYYLVSTKNSSHHQKWLYKESLQSKRLVEIQIRLGCRTTPFPTNKKIPPFFLLSQRPKNCGWTMRTCPVKPHNTMLKIDGLYSFGLYLLFIQLRIILTAQPTSPHLVVPMPQWKYLAFQMHHMTWQSPLFAKYFNHHLHQK